MAYNIVKPEANPRAQPLGRPGKTAQPPIAAVSISGDELRWDRFWCLGCQAERDLSMKVQVNRHRLGCAICAAVIGKPKGKAGRKADPRAWAEDYVSEPDEAIPDDAVAAYRESVEGG